MEISAQTLSAALPELLAEGLVMRLARYGDGYWPVLYAEIRGSRFCLATHTCENDRDVPRLDFDLIDAWYFEGRMESFTLSYQGKEVGVGYPLADIGEEVFSPEVLEAVAREKAKPRIVPFAREVIEDLEGHG